jgi:hypothetical protein
MTHTLLQIKAIRFVKTEEQHRTTHRCASEGLEWNGYWTHLRKKGKERTSLVFTFLQIWLSYWSSLPLSTIPMPCHCTDWATLAMPPVVWAFSQTDKYKTCEYIWPWNLQEVSQPTSSSRVSPVVSTSVALPNKQISPTGLRERKSSFRQPATLIKNAAVFQIQSYIMGCSPFPRKVCGDQTKCRTRYTSRVAFI